jgi:23S rRNA (uracil1939-C5)-methyltransferase
MSTDGAFGFFAKHSHRVVPCSRCLLQPQIFDEIMANVTRWARKYGIAPYDETKNKGLFRHLYLRIAEKTDEIMAVAVINGNKLPFEDEFVQCIKSVCGDRLKSVQINENKEKTNVIMGKKCRTLYGQDCITDVLCGIKVRISPLSFYQVNRDMAEKLYLKAADYAKPRGKNILDLYCGAGTIGLSMANEATSVVGVEVVPEAIEDAKFNAQNNGINNARFICADAAKAAEVLAAENYLPDVVIVDPPRKGCSEELIKTIAYKFSPDRVVYVSCDPATLARDIKFFSENGYKLIEYTPADLFPRTSHVETAALLIKG